MEQRKIQETGGGTFTVSLPREWADSVGLEKGSVVDLHPYLDGTIAIQTRESEDTSLDSVTVPVETADTASLEPLVRSAYAAGYDTITFRADDGLTHDHRRALRAAANQYQGVTIAEERDSQITVRVLLDSAEVSVPQLVRQLKFVVLSAYSDAVSSVAGAEEPTDSAPPGEQVDRLYATTERTLQRALARLDEVDDIGLTRSELFQLWGAAYELKQVGDHAQRIRDIGESDVDPACPDRLLDLSQLSRSIVEDGVSAVLGEAATDVARRAVRNRDEVRTRADRLHGRLFELPDADRRVVRVLDSVERTAEHGGTIAERAVQLALHRRDVSTLSSSSDGASDREPESRPP